MISNTLKLQLELTKLNIL